MANILKKKKQVEICLFNIRSAHNVGSIFRTGDAVGVSQIYLIGTTPAPLDRFQRSRKDIAKVALGAEKNIPYKYFKNWTAFKKFADKEKKYLVALEQDERAIDYKKFRHEGGFCLVLGEEVKGIPKKVLDDMAKILEIKMVGKKESLNVSVAAGIALYQILKI